MSMPVIVPGTITREEAVGNIIESIAMEEKGISHILNAESEKLNAIINSPNVSAEALIAANKSVKKTVDNIIDLEMNLKNKLNLFSETICQTN
ncbi:MAG: hypothetical protein RR929_04340 [Erysipelotrichaceae bacterium]